MRTLRPEGRLIRASSSFAKFPGPALKERQTMLKCFSVVYFYDLFHQTFCTCARSVHWIACPSVFALALFDAILAVAVVRALILALKQNTCFVSSCTRDFIFLFPRGRRVFEELVQMWFCLPFSLEIQEDTCIRPTRGRTWLRCSSRTARRTPPRTSLAGMGWRTRGPGKRLC